MATFPIGASTMAGKTSRKSAKVAEKSAKPRKAAPRSESGKVAKLALLAGGNPQIAKADGDVPASGAASTRSSCAPSPACARRSKWNSPLYGVEGEGWFLGIHCFTKHVKVAFFRGTSLRPVPPASPSRRKCATSTSTRTTSSTRFNSPTG